MTTATLQQQATETIAASVLRHCEDLCATLRQHYINYSIASHNRFIAEDRDTEYHQKAIEKLKNGECDYLYTITTGKRYHKIIMEIHYKSGRIARSVHAFVDKNTGEVYKPASWQSPAKGVRYDLRLIRDRLWLQEHADWSGSYLYSR